MQPLHRLLALAAGALVLVGAACSSNSLPAPGSATPAATTDEVRLSQLTPTADDGSEGQVDDSISVASLVDAVEQSVVRIESSNNVFGGGVGSGFVVDADGYIMTNNHVVEVANGEVADSIKVTLFDGAVVDATVVGRDVRTDTALLKIDRTGLTPLPFAPLESVEVGEEVIALGFPLDLDGGEESGVTVTRGIVSAKNRGIQEGNGIVVLGAIQTDAAINHGNSGGPLVNRAGEVVGMNTAIASDNTGSVAAGIGFAVGSDTLAAVNGRIREDGSVNRGFLGIEGFSAVRPAEARELGIPEDGGIRVETVLNGGPVATAGLQPGDVIADLGGTPIRTEADLAVALIRNGAGDDVVLGFYRDGERQEITVTLGQFPAS